MEPAPDQGCIVCSDKKWKLSDKTLDRILFCQGSVSLCVGCQGDAKKAIHSKEEALRDFEERPHPEGSVCTQDPEYDPEYDDKECEHCIRWDSKRRRLLREPKRTLAKSLWLRKVKTVGIVLLRVQESVCASCGGKTHRRIRMPDAPLHCDRCGSVRETRKDFEKIIFGLP